MTAFLLLSLGAKSVLSQRVSQQLMLFFITLSLTRQTVLSIFRWLEEFGNFNAGATAHYANASCVVANGKFDVKFNFTTAHPSAVNLANLQNEELPCCGFGELCQAYSDGLDCVCSQIPYYNTYQGEAYAYYASSLEKHTLNTIGCIFRDSNDYIAASSTGMGSRGRLPATVMPNVGLGAFGNCQFITTGYGELLNGADGLMTLSAVAQNLPLINFYAANAQMDQSELLEVQWTIGLFSFTAEQLAFEANCEAINYFWLMENVVCCLVSMWYFIVIANVHGAACLKILRPVRLIINSLS